MPAGVLTIVVLAALVVDVGLHPVGARMIPIPIGLIDCPRCKGSGEIHFNPSPINDPQCADSATCHVCHGDGMVRADDPDRCIVCGTTPNIRCCQYGRDH